MRSVSSAIGAYFKDRANETSKSNQEAVKRHFRSNRADSVLISPAALVMQRLPIRELTFEELRDYVRGVKARAQMNPSYPGYPDNWKELGTHFAKLYFAKIHGMIERGESLQSIPYEEFNEFYRIHNNTNPAITTIDGTHPDDYKRLCWEGKSRQHFENLGREVLERYRNGENITSDEHNWMGTYIAALSREIGWAALDVERGAKMDRNMILAYNDLTKAIRESGITLEDNETFEIVSTLSGKVTVVGIEDEDKRRQIENAIQSYNDSANAHNWWHYYGQKDWSPAYLQEPNRELTIVVGNLERYIKMNTNEDISLKDLSVDSKGLIHGLPEPLSTKLNDAVILPNWIYTGYTQEQGARLGLYGPNADEILHMSELKKALTSTLQNLQKIGGYDALPPSDVYFQYGNGALTAIDKYKT
ncbi:MAG: hypothetical protein FWG09_04065 [Synergistaceae bacterium]|nr:hypothetical protein [Synergistaceae bacterium]